MVTKVYEFMAKAPSVVIDSETATGMLICGSMLIIVGGILIYLCVRRPKNDQ